jgi:peptidoglycan hydrolase-like protein with peptidoglycan-binding domain
MTSPIRGSGKQLQLQPAKALNAESMNDEIDSANPTMNKSSSREDVRLLQSQLKAAGFDPGPLDGVLGVKTKSALEQYQKVYGAAPLRKVSTDAGPKSDY